MKKKLLSLFLAAAMSVGLLASCGPVEDEVTYEKAPLVVGYTSFNEVFSPFYAKSEGDKAVVDMTQVYLLTLDREGSAVMNGIQGETREYAGKDYTYYGIADIEKLSVKGAQDKSVYEIKLREDLKYSDGVLTADDVIFSMYVLCDPTYDGPYTLKNAPILGLKEYQDSMTTLYQALLIAGRENTDFTLWDETVQTTFWSEIDAAGTDFAQAIVDYLAESSGTTSVASAAKLWGYDGFEETATAADFFYVLAEAYNWDLEAMSQGEAVGKGFASRMENYDAYQKGVSLNPEVVNIAGIEKTGDYSLRITMTDTKASNLSYLNIPIVPMKYYGTLDLYNYENNQFGFVKGDLTEIKSMMSAPIGAGPYNFMALAKAAAEEEEDGDKEFVFEANEYYYLGKPLTQTVRFVEISSGRKIKGVSNGTIDLTDVSLTEKVAANISETNETHRNELIAEAAGAGEMVEDAALADVVSLDSFPYLGYGYIGINADVMSVNGHPETEKSLNLRKAFATLFAVYREEVIFDYFGGNASVVNYPVSDSSWAAPKPGEEGYETAYSQGLDGENLYKETMTLPEKHKAAQAAALEYFKAAGFRVEDGKVVDAPEGAALRYDVMVSGNGLGEHPVYIILIKVKEDLAELGINLVIKDVTETDQMWTALKEGNCGLWAAAWDSQSDPDLYDIYHRDGAYSYMYDMEDEELSALIEDANEATEETDRRAVYKQCYDRILDLAIEVPVYQKYNGVIYSQQRIKGDTLVQDMTEYYNWMDEIHTLEMYDVIVEEAKSTEQ